MIQCKVEVTTFGDASPRYLVYDDGQLGVYHDTDLHGFCHPHIRLNREQVLRIGEVGERFWVAPLPVGNPVHRADECPK